MWIVHGHVYEVECILFIYNEYCVSFDSTFCVTTGFWLIIMSSDIVITPKSGLPKGKGSVLTVLGTLKTIAKSLKRAKFSPSLGLVKLKDFQLQGGGALSPWPSGNISFPKGSLMFGMHFHHLLWMLHPSTHSRKIWMNFGKTWALKASFSAHHPSRYKIQELGLG